MYASLVHKANLKSNYLSTAAVIFAINIFVLKNRGDILKYAFRLTSNRQTQTGVKGCACDRQVYKQYATGQTDRQMADKQADRQA